MIDQTELVTLLGSAGMGFLASFGTEAYVDKMEALKIEQLGPLARPSSYGNLVAGALAGILGSAGRRGKGPIDDALLQNVLMGLGTGLSVGGILATVRPKIVPISEEGKAVVGEEIIRALESRGARVPVEVREALIKPTTATTAFAIPASSDKAAFAKTFGY